ASPALAQERTPLGPAFLAVLASTLLRAPWLALALIMPRAGFGGVVFYLVIACAGIVLLHWCLSWFEWTVSFRAAFAARALPGLAAAALAGAIGFRASLPAVLGLAILEFVLSIVIVAASGTRA